MKRFIRTAAAVLGGAVICAWGQDMEDVTPAPARILSTEISGSDLAFFAGAGPAMALLTELAELAKTRAVTPEVKGDAALVWKEQTDAAERLRELAERKGAPVADEPDEPGKRVLEALGKLKGVKFDKTYLDAQEDARGALETSLEVGAGSGDAAIKALAGRELGVLKEEGERGRKLGM